MAVEEPSIEAASARTTPRGAAPSLSIDVDPHHGQALACHAYTVLLSNPDGTIAGEDRQGLFDHDTRVLSAWTLRLDGVPPRLDSSGLVDARHWCARLTVPRAGGTARGPQLPQDALEVTVRREIGEGMREWITVENHGATVATTHLAMDVSADFRDVQDVAGSRPVPGHVTASWDQAASALTFDYQAEHGTRTVHRALRLHVAGAGSPPRHTGTGLAFEMALAPRGCWRAELVYEILVDGHWRSPADHVLRLADRDRIAAAWHRNRLQVESNPSSLGLTFERAADDLAALRNWELDAAPDAWVPNAGLPTYTGLFGRDILTAGWQAALLGPDLLRGAVARLAATQAAADSAWHDAEPGKMIHEMRRGPLAELEIIPQRAYYGTQTASSFFAITLSELWHWTGDDSLLHTYVDAALQTFEWAARYGDRDGDGFLEYKTRSKDGLANQGWKDSDEAIRYPDGRLVESPIAAVEEQAFHWLALQRMAEILIAIGREDEADRFVQQARDLRRRWHDAFWMEDEGFYAMALDPAKRAVRSVGSNPGHALAAGLVPTEYARRVADRLLAPDLFSGWGIRTLSSNHPSYNPLAYHLGTVWPAENATFALGFKRYGLDHHLNRLMTAFFDAASLFRHHRLPEALGGHSREDAPIPTVYPHANAPQAWSASAAIQMVQTMLGIYPFAPARVLALVRPTLPPWLNSVTLEGIQVGEARVSIRFERTSAGRTTSDVRHRAGSLHVLHVPPPQEGAEAVGWRDTLARWLLDHAPGRTATALRLALGKGP